MEGLFFRSLKGTKLIFVLRSGSDEVISAVLPIHSLRLYLNRRAALEIMAFELNSESQHAIKQHLFFNILCFKFVTNSSWPHPSRSEQPEGRVNRI